LGLLDGVAAIVVPSIPFVLGRSTGDLVFGIVRASDVDDLASFHARAALWGRNLCLAFPDGEFRLRVRVDLDAVDTLTQGAHRHVRGVDFHIRLRALEYGVVDNAACHLELNVLLREVGDLHIGILVHP
jgi:hypothetical protein